MALKCTMILGDCFSVINNQELQDPNLIVCDPPFGCSNLEWDKSLGSNFIDRIYIPLRTNVPLLVSFCSEDVLHNWRQESKTKYKYFIIWAKTRGSNYYAAKYRPLVAHELVAIWGNGKTYNPQMRNGFAPHKRTEGTKECEFYNKRLRPKGTNISSGTRRFPLSILEFDKDFAHRRRGKNVNMPKAHSSQKPVPLVDWLIRTYSNQSDNVLDPTSGSGTTAVAALSCGRNVTCIERDEGYFAASVERVRKHCRDNFIRADIEVVR